jgi:ABC-type glycerol-3-phosphate transport system permease component
MKMINEVLIKRRAKSLGKNSINTTEKINRRIQDSEGVMKYIKFLLKAFVLIFFGFIVIFPFYFMLARSLMTYEESIDPTSPLAPNIPQ